MTQTTPTGNGARTFLAWVWAGVLILGGGVYLAQATGLVGFGGPAALALAGGLGLLAVPFAARRLAHRADWWAALTAYVMAALAVFVLAVTFIGRPAQIVIATALIEMALPFGAVYLADRRRWWALLPLYTLVVLAGLLALTILTIPLEALGAFALLAAGVPFWVAYMVNKQTWWALIPAGVLSGAGVLALGALAALRPGSGGFYVVLNLALAGVLFAVWLTARRFEWAIWLATGFVLAAALAVWFPSGASLAMVALALGVYIAYKQIEATRARKMAAQGAGQPAPARPAPAAPPQPPTGGGASGALGPNTPPPPAPPQPAPGAQIDREATAGHEARREAGTSGPSPTVEFRPIDPFKGRREAEKRENGKGDETDD
jgi:hypothetical protein